VDILLLESDDFEAYKQDDAFSFLPMSRLNTFATGFVESGMDELVSGTEYYLIIDNTNKPAGGAFPSGPEDEAQVAFELGGGNVESIAAGSNFMSLFIIIGVVVAIVVIVVLFFLFKGMKSKGGMPGKYPATGFKVCPRCGAQAPSEYTFCPKCGNRI
ncbi:MAG: zinc ribbon domain-containing protein, partial [Methanomassiliicoccales archaeon]|nr:zinc ribbon domain-containing protein [Methanomassiliicoccales archaeon]